MSNINTKGTRVTSVKCHRIRVRRRPSTSVMSKLEKARRLNENRVRLNERKFGVMTVHEALGKAGLM